MSADGLQARYEKNLRDTGYVASRCPYCGKRSARQYPSEKWSVYRCPEDTGFYHLGHQSARITYGYETRLERYGKTAS